MKLNSRACSKQKTFQVSNQGIQTMPKHPLRLKKTSETKFNQLYFNLYIFEKQKVERNFYVKLTSRNIVGQLKGHKILQNLPLTFDRSTLSQK